uniref:Peptidase S1 domain-containing protein n=1 Tax=Panagrolaimus sp. JU765 TaxID=591449 RepID=A0AC34QSI1_9BILA
MRLHFLLLFAIFYQGFCEFAGKEVSADGNDHLRPGKPMSGDGNDIFRPGRPVFGNDHLRPGKPVSGNGNDIFRPGKPLAGNHLRPGRQANGNRNDHLRPGRPVSGDGNDIFRPGKPGGIRKSDLRPKPKIGGGKNDVGLKRPNASLPFVRVKFMNGSEPCSGTVIAKEWVLTAAHCFKGLSDKFFAKELLYFQSSMPGDGEYVSVKSGVFRHPGFNYTVSIRGNVTAIHDIALVKLDKAIKNYMIPAKLANYEPKPGDTFDVYGFGAYDAISFDSKVTYKYDRKLRLGKARFVGLDKQLSVFITRGRAITLDGDSGGPAMIRDAKDGQYYIAGVHSMSYPSFNYEINPALTSSYHTLIGPYCDWIKKITKVGCVKVEKNVVKPNL